MLKKLCFIALSLSFAACGTPTKQTIDMAKLKPEERVYTGNIQVNLNDKLNPDLTCDLFMNSDFAPTVRLAHDGEYLFKTNKKTLAFTRISCLYTHDKKQLWIHQKLGIPRITQPDETKAKDVHNLGTITVNWTVKDSDFEKGADVMATKDPMAPIGKIQVTETKPVPAPVNN